MTNLLTPIDRSADDASDLALEIASQRILRNSIPGRKLS